MPNATDTPDTDFRPQHSPDATNAGWALLRTESFVLDPLEAQLIENLRQVEWCHRETMLALSWQYRRLMPAPFVYRTVRSSRARVIPGDKSRLIHFGFASLFSVRSSEMREPSLGLFTECSTAVAVHSIVARHVVEADVGLGAGANCVGRYECKVQS